MRNNKKKYCPFCHKEIDFLEKKCRHCGEWLDKTARKSSLKLIEAFSEQYEIINDIRSGGMAEVYKAKQKSLGRIVALKVIPREFIENNKDFVVRFKKEAKKAASLNHQNIITIYDSGELNGYPFISMQYLGGGTLSEYIHKQRSFKEKEIAKVLLPVLNGLDYAHKKGIIHCDIKSSNIMFDDNMTPILTDFGISISHGENINIASEFYSGTPEYSSPEQVNFQYVDYRTDIYSLAVVAYEMATGEVPFRGKNTTEIFQKVKNKIPKPINTINQNISQGFSDSIQKALLKNPSDRFEDCMSFIRSFSNSKLNRNRISEKSKKTNKSLNLKIGKFIQQNKLLMSVVLLLTLIIVTLLFYYFNEITLNSGLQSTTPNGKQIKQSTYIYPHSSNLHKNIPKEEKKIHTGYINTLSGLSYKFHYRSGKYITPKITDTVLVDMIVNTEDTLLIDSRLENHPFKIPMKKSVHVADIYNGLSLMSEGDSATFICDADSVFLKLFKFEQIPKYLKNTEYVFFHVKLRKILSRNNGGF